MIYRPELPLNDNYRQEQINDFVRDHNWQTVFAIWQQRVSQHSPSLAPLFTHVPVHDPAIPQDRPTVYSWWPRESTYDTKQKDIQRHLDRFPGTLGPIHWYQHTRQGEINTLEYLWQAQGNLERVAAILIAASLFTRVRSGRSTYPRDAWPLRSCVSIIETWAYEVWKRDGHFTGWQTSCTEVLPKRKDDYYCDLKSLEDVVTYLADEHIQLLTEFAPIAIDFVPERAPVIEAELNEEYAEEQRRIEESRMRFSEEEEQRRQEKARRRQQHPRSDEWRELSTEELQRLVWTKSMLQLSEEFGKSNVAIKKRCKKLGIPTPPVGFWAKVYSGKIPHPNGVPVGDA